MVKQFQEAYGREPDPADLVDAIDDGGGTLRLCHQGVNVGGNLFQRHGIFHPLGSPEPELVRVPSLRNVATTPPYFHDGSTATLPEAVKAMGYAQLDRVLTDQQTAAIVAFLKTLTGTYRGAPVTPAATAPRAVAPP